MLFTACVPLPTLQPTDSLTEPPSIPTPTIFATPLPTRPSYNPGELVDYTAQTGDTLPALAAHFNTTVEEILEANPIIPADVTTLPPGLPMQIPIYYRSAWGTSYQIVQDSLFINGPAARDFDTASFIEGFPGWLKDYQGDDGIADPSGAGIVDYVASNYSISPRVLLALLEYQTGALSQPDMPSGSSLNYLLGSVSIQHRGLYLQLAWVANLLNNGYYGWRSGKLVEFDRPDGRLEQPDPWQNAATVAFQYYFSQNPAAGDYDQAIGPAGIALTYEELFGDPWQAVEAHIPGSLQQPTLQLPFEVGKSWSFTGGPHTGWGDGEPWAALDFAPPAVLGGCTPSSEWATAVAAGIVVRSETGIVVLDLDGDGDERTGWVIFYLHVGTNGRAALGAQLEAGDLIGHPSCERGTSTGTHIHVARKFNGEWIAAAGALPFVMEGWLPADGDAPYQGTLTRFERTVTASTTSNEGTVIESRGIEETP